MEFIVAVNDDWAIGYDGKMLHHLPEDLAFFKKTTSGHIVFMGRKTFESLPGGALPNRVNVVLTDNKDYVAAGAHVIHDLNELAPIVDSYPDKKIFVMGGGDVYRQLLDHCSAGYVTMIHAHAEKADTWFPDLDALPEWQVSDILMNGHDNGFDYTIKRYERDTN